MATNAFVQVTYVPGSKSSLTVKPEDAGITGPGAATWGLDAPPGFSAEINFTVQGGHKGPFSEGVFRSSVGSPASSGPARYGSNGAWKYDVTIFNDKGAQVDYLDPTVVIGGNP
jgi:hypothetical protein